MANIGDIATLGFDIDSSPAARGAKDLDNLASSAKKVQRATDDLRLSSQNQMRATTQLVDTMVRSTRATASAAAEASNQARATRDAAAAALAEVKATQQSIQARMQLEKTRQQEATSARAAASALGRYNQLQDYSNRLNKQAEQQTKALAAAQDKYNASLRSYGAAEATSRSAQSMQSNLTATQFQSRINATTGVGQSTGTTQADIDAYAASLDALRAKYNPVYAASKQYENELKAVREAHTVGAISAAEMEAAEERLRIAFEANTVAGNKFSGMTGSARAGLVNLSYQLNDVVSGLAMGQSPFQILTQQGGQFVQIMQQTGTGPIGLIKQVGSVLSSIITPARLAGLAIVGVAAGLAKLYSDAIDNEKKLQAALSGTGRAAGVTGSQLEQMSQDAAKSAKISVGAARDIAIEYAKSGSVAGDQIKQLTELTADYASTTGQDIPSATKQLAGAFGNLKSGVDTINKAIGGLTYAEREHIKTLEATGQHEKAVQATLDALKPSLVDHATQLTLIGRAWEAIKNAASGAVTNIMTKAVPTTQQQLAIAQAELARLQGVGQMSGAGGSASAVAAKQAQVNELLARQAAEQKQARDRAATTVANNLADNAAPGLAQFTPGFADKKALQDQADLFAALMKNQQALKASGFSYQQAEAAQKAYTSAVSNYITPAERATRQSQLDVAAIKAKTPEQKASIAAQQVELSLMGQAIPAEEKAARVRAAYTEALAQGNQQLAIEAQTARLTIAGNLALADSWTRGAGAAMSATAQTQAQVKALSDGGNVAKRMKDAVEEQASSAVAAASQQTDSLRMQMMAQKAANDAVADGTISYTEAATYAQRYQDQQELEVLKTNDIVKANKDLVDAINKVIAARKAANDNFDYEHDRSVIAQTNKEIEEQTRLAGMGAQERERESVVLEAIHQTNGRITEAEKDNIRASIEHRQEVERLREVVDDVGSAFEDMFTDVFEHGKLSFGKLVDDIKSIFARLLAQLATQAIMQPIIMPIVGQMMGLNGLSGFGGGIGSISSGGGGFLGSAVNGLGLFGGSGSGGLMSSMLPSSGLFGGIGNAISGAGKFLFGAPDTILAGGETLGGVNATGATGLFGSAGLGAVLGGFGAGSLASSLIFGNKNDAGIGGMSGAAAGAILGSVVPGIGTLIGGLAGGLLGGGLGSMTGSSNQGAIANFNADGSNYLFKQGGGNNGAMATQAATTVTQVIQGLASKGVTVSLGNISGLSIGSDKSYVYGYDGMKEKLAGGEQGITAVVSSILSKILPGATGGDANTQTILNKYRQNGGVTSDNLQQLLSDLDFAKSLANFDFGVKSLTQSQQLLKNISDQFEGAIQKAQQLGLDTTQLVSARDSAIQKVVSDYNDSISSALEQITDPVKYAFDQLKKTQQQRIEDAQGLGADLSRVYALNKAELDALVKQYSQATDGLVSDTGAVTKTFESTADALSALKTAYSKQQNDLQKQQSTLQQTIDQYTQLSISMRQFSAGLGVSSATTSSQRYANASSLFNDVSSRARAGDKNAIAQLQDVSNQLIAASQDNSATMTDYARDVARVRTAIDDVASSADAQAASAQNQLDVANQQLKALDAQVAGLGIIDESVKSVEQAIKDLKDAQARDLAAVASASASAAADAAGYAASIAAAQSYNAMIQGYAAEASPPGFASGGTHSGGWRVVGENGPELEHTGPSQIFNNGDSLFDSSDIVSELIAIKEAVENINANVKTGVGFSKRIKDLFEAITSKSGGTSVTTNT